MYNAVSNNNNKVEYVKLQLDNIVKCLKLDQAIWRNSHISGWNTVQNILKIQAKILNLESNLPNLQIQRRLDSNKVEFKRLQHERKLSCNALNKLVKRLADANERMRISLKQLRQWAKDRALGDYVFFRSWTLQDILKFVDQIICLYDAEYEIKIMVAEDITKLQTYEELRIFRLAWLYPRHALTSEFNTMFENFRNETEATI